METWEEPRRDIEAAVRRVGGPLVRPVQIGTVALGTLAAFETTLWTPVAVAVAFSLCLEYVRRLDDPGPVTKTHKVERSGLSEREVTDYLTMSNTLKEMEAETREDARREAERKAKMRR